MERINKVENLLHIVSNISKKYEEIINRTGENFNIFKIIGVERDETRLHSSFIAELFHSKGSHNLGNKLLGIFITQQIRKLEMKKHIEGEENGNINEEFVKKLNNFQFNSETIYKAETEKHIGYINEDKTEGGRIDIVVQDLREKNVIIFENKIYAPDQKSQLIRYHNKYQNAPIFYLTLDGKTPDNVSSSHKDKKIEIGKDIVCISYKEDIINWLEECLKESYKYPFLRETIAQYIHVIKKLTRQTMNENKKEEIINSISSSLENFEAAKEICYNFIDAQIRFFYDLWCNELEKNFKDYKTDIMKENDYECGIKMTTKYQEIFLIIGVDDSRNNMPYMVIRKKDNNEHNKDFYNELKMKLTTNFNNNRVDFCEDNIDYCYMYLKNFDTAFDEFRKIIEFFLQNFAINNQ